MKRIICKHCGRIRYPKQQGLCWSCARDSNIRNRYPSTHKSARRGIKDTYGGLQLPNSSTQAAAGSLDKIVVLEERAALGQSLWHPDDSKQLDLEALTAQHGNPRIGRHSETYGGKPCKRSQMR